MNIIAQLIQLSTGARSHPFEHTREGLANELTQTIAEWPEKVQDQAIIILMEKQPTEEDWQYSTAPFFLLTDFNELFSSDKVNGVLTGVEQSYITTQAVNQN